MPSVRPEFVTAALSMAEDSLCPVKHATLVVRGRRVLAAATNKLKTHPAYPRQKSYHAEAVALMRCNGDARGAVLYSFRNGLGKKSRPCKPCMTMVKERGIRLIVYSDWPTKQVLMEKV